MDDAETSFSETTPLTGQTQDDYNKQYNSVQPSEQNNEGLWNSPSVKQPEATPRTTPKHGERGDSVTFSTMTKRQILILSLCSVAMFLVHCAASLLGAFYVREALKKEMSITMAGFVVGVFQLTLFLFAPVFGNYMTKIGPKFCCVAGFLVGGCCNILFGTLNKAPNGSPFIVTSIIVRFVEAISFSSFITAGFAITVSEFPKNVGFIFGILETSIGLGFMTGPIIGAGLYELGGYSLPFYVVGVAVLFNGLLMYTFIPSQPVVERKKGSIFTLFRSPRVAIAVVSIFLGSAGELAYQPTFIEHLAPFNLSPSVASLFYSTASVTYTFMSIFWGYITDKKESILIPLIVFGHLLFCVGYLLLGPSPLLPFVPFKLWSLAIGMVLFGISIGCLLIPGMKLMLHAACDMGFEDNIDTYALVSGIFNSFLYIGGFIGPVTVGGLVDAYGYPIAYSAAGIVQLVGLLFPALYLSYRCILNMREAGTTLAYTKIGESSVWIDEDMFHVRSGI